MNISFILDREEQIDPNDALGDIIISDDKNQIYVHSTYLDSWFNALIKGYKTLEKKQIITIEIIEEPDLITFKPLVDGFQIIYGKQNITFTKINDFYKCLLNATHDFIEQFERENIKLSNHPLFTKIYHFQEHFKVKGLNLTTIN